MEPYEIERLVRIEHEGEILQSKPNKKGVAPFLYTHVLGVGPESWELCAILTSSQGIERARKGALLDSDMGNVIAGGSTKDLFVYSSNDGFQAESDGRVIDLRGNSKATTGREDKNLAILMEQFCRVRPAMAPVDYFFDFVERWMDRGTREPKTSQRMVMFEGILQRSMGLPEAQNGVPAGLFVDDQGIRLFYTGDASKPPVMLDPGYATLLKVEASGREAGRESPGVSGFGFGVVGSVKSILGARIVNEVFATDTPPSCLLRFIYQDAMFEMRLSPPLPPSVVLAPFGGIRVHLETERLKREGSDNTALREVSRMEELERAIDLRDRGELTDEEFQVVRSRILGTQ